MELTSKELKSYVSFLKRIAAESEFFYVCNGVWYPFQSSTVIKDTLTDNHLDGIIYSIRDVTNIAKYIEGLKGKKNTIQYVEEENEICLVINDERIKIGYNATNEFTQEAAKKLLDKKFTDYLNPHKFYPIPTEELQDIKDGHVRTYQIDGSTVRIAISLFTLRGVARKDAPVNFQSEIAVEDRDDNVKNLILHCNYPVLECIHKYPFYFYG